MDPWLWAVILLIGGMLFGIMEVFFPSAGILAFLSAASIIAAIVVGFQQSTGVGIVILVAAVAGLPTLIVLAFKYWPQTAMGRRVLLHAPASDDVLPDDPTKELLKNIIGKAGKAKSKLLPSGVITLDGRTINAVSEGGPIEAGQAVRVLQIRGKRAVVRPIDEKEALSREDLLSQPIESLIEDPFKERPG
jgi:membrane-bound ClpP family serine protease